MTQKLLWLYKREQILLALHEWKDAVELLILLDSAKPYKKTNFKEVRVDEFVFWAGSMLSYRAGLGKGNLHSVNF